MQYTIVFQRDHILLRASMTVFQHGHILTRAPMTVFWRDHILRRATIAISLGFKMMSVAERCWTRKYKITCSSECIAVSIII